MPQLTVLVTGTERGGTLVQLKVADVLLRSWQPSLLLHGGCIGVDDELDALAVELNISREIFPSTLLNKRVPDEVFQRRGGSLVIHPPAPPLSRNRVMVRRASRVLALPAEAREILRSGTWTTVRYARALLSRDRIYAVAPDGGFIR